MIKYDRFPFDWLWTMKFLLIVNMPVSTNFDCIHVTLSIPWVTFPQITPLFHPLCHSSPLRHFSTTYVTSLRPVFGSFFRVSPLTLPPPTSLTLGQLLDIFFRVSPLTLPPLTPLHHPLEWYRHCSTSYATSLTPVCFPERYPQEASSGTDRAALAQIMRRGVLFCAFLCFPVLFCAFLCFSVLFCAFLWFYLLFCAFLWFSVIFCDLMCFSVLFCDFMCFSVLFCNFMCFSVLFCALLGFNVLFCDFLCFSVILCAFICF